MTMIIDGSSGATFPNSSVQASAGKIIQVVQASATTTVSTTTQNSFVDTTLSASITPKFSNSTILIIVCQNIECYGTNQDVQGNINICRGSSVIFGGYAWDQFRYKASTGGDLSFASSFAITYIDSPATTSSTTYKTQISLRSSSGTMIAQNNNQPSYITLLEIAA